MRDREVEADDGVDRDHQRRRQAREQQVRSFIPVPVTRRAAPAHGEHAVDDLAGLRLRPVAQRRQIWNQSDKPEEQRDRRVSRDGKHIPHQRAAELRPQAHRVRIGKQPVVEPRTADVDSREDRGAGDGKQRHRFGEPVDGGPPRLPQQQQDRGNQRAGVADADPPYEVDDGKCPRRPEC